MSLPFISIIIPIYQVEAYIEECLLSVSQQTYQGRLECILVDDCGKDRTMDITKQFVESYTGPISFRILHHQYNRGLSAARNTGMMATEGEYILFIDSDDKITPDCIEELANCLKKEKVDIICGAFKTIGGFRQWWSDGYHLTNFTSTNPDEIIDFYAMGKLYEMAWNKLIRKEILINHHLFFKEGILMEDKLWSLLLVNHISSIQTINKVTYYYRIQNKSIMNDDSQLPKRIHGSVVIQEEMNKYIKNRTIKPTQQTIFRIRREKNRTGGAIIRCKSLSFWEKLSYFYRLLRLPGSHHFIYNLVRHYKKYENNPL